MIVILLDSYTGENYSNYCRSGNTAVMVVSRESKKQDTLLLPITLPYVDRCSSGNLISHQLTEQTRRTINKYNKQWSHTEPIIANKSNISKVFSHCYFLWSTLIDSKLSMHIDIATTGNITTGLHNAKPEKHSAEHTSPPKAIQHKQLKSHQ